MLLLDDGVNAKPDEYLGVFEEDIMLFKVGDVEASAVLEV